MARGILISFAGYPYTPSSLMPDNGLASLAGCLLAAGHTVAAVEVDPTRFRKASRRVRSLLKGMVEENLLKSKPRSILRRLTISADYAALRNSQIVIECVAEDLDVKRAVIRSIAQVVSSDTIIGSNTSAIPPTLLQQGALHPERILGIHWA